MEVSPTVAALVIGFPLLMLFVLLLMNAVERRLTGPGRPRGGSDGRDRPLATASAAATATPAPPPATVTSTPAEPAAPLGSANSPAPTSRPAAAA
ncbi:MAG: hypothetical protein IRZ08_11715 [Frankia sp.]|nr:hypothetical protein [Frankia sp.]